MKGEIRALRAFAKAFEPLAICRYGDNRLEDMRSREDCIRYGGEGDPQRWKRLDRAYKRLIDLGVIEP